MPIFLSASVPDAARDPRYHDTSDVIAIRDAVRALVTVVLPHGRLIWGGHPAITPLVRVVAEGIGATDERRVTLYQSRYFRRKAPKDNAAFESVVWTPATRGDPERSIAVMRERMLGSEQFRAGVFIGGMEGVEVEYEMFRRLHPDAVAAPVASTGAAAAAIFARDRARFPAELETDLAYPTLFRKVLRIGP